jgi:YidC/Oxa1 family membrane protein insertase
MKMIPLTRLFILLATFSLTCYGHDEQQEPPGAQEKINTIIHKRIKQKEQFFGLASYYNNIKAYIVDENGVRTLSHNFQRLEPKQHLIVVGYHHALPLKNIQGNVALVENQLIWKEYNASSHINATLNDGIISKKHIDKLPISHHEIKYINLWKPIAVLCTYIELMLLWINSIHAFGWGLSIILLSLFFKLLTIPANVLLIRSQKKASRIQSLLAPKLKHIEKNFAGEEAHKMLMATYREANVSPFYAVKPITIGLIPVPFLISIFNVLGNLDDLSGQSFLWISDLSRPDVIATFSSTIPTLGNSIHLLPILMTMITIVMAKSHQNQIVSATELQSQKRNLYLMAFTFLFLFYPFPSAMVLYWTCANFWQMIQQRMIHI